MNKFKFNISYVYSIGHSVSAATMKGIARTRVFPGIAFETKDSNILAINTDKKLNSFESAGSNRVNVYSEGSLFASHDDTYEVNGKLPEMFFNPNVYETACLTTVVCSKTKKYIPLCEQVLSKNEDETSSNFQDILDAFNK